jgi:hypothetical protein
MGNPEDLTPAEQRCFERAGEAQQRGLTLEQYHGASGLSLRWLHKVRRQLRRKGVVAPERAARSAAPGSDKIVEGARGAAAGAKGVGCGAPSSKRLGDECVSWPPGSWLAECFWGARHAAA